MTPYIEPPIGPSDLRRIWAEVMATTAAQELRITTPRVRFFLHRPKPDAGRSGHGPTNGT